MVVMALVFVIPERVFKSVLSATSEDGIFFKRSEPLWMQRMRWWETSVKRTDVTLVMRYLVLLFLFFEGIFRCF